MPFKFLTEGGFISSGTLVPNWNITPLTSSPVPARIRLISCQEIPNRVNRALDLLVARVQAIRLVREPVRITREMEYVKKKLRDNIR